MLDDVADLRAAVARGGVIIVAGAGVTAAATCGAPAATWIGLLESGISHVQEVAHDLPHGWEAAVRQEQELAANGYMPSVTGLADKVLDALGGRAGPAFAEWLRAQVGGLELRSRDLVDAIVGLGAPIATTNYDGLFEDATGRHYATWRQTSHAQMALQGQSEDIVHLHGHWREPESIVLDGFSYGALSAHAPAQALERAVGTVRTLLFVGCGDGVYDPHFGALRGWLKDTFRTEAKHYRLCLDGELDALRTEHRDERIVPIAYGATHSDLVSFLRALGSVRKTGHGLTAVAAPERVRSALRAGAHRHRPRRPPARRGHPAAGHSPRAPGAPAHEPRAVRRGPEPREGPAPEAL